MCCCCSQSTMWACPIRTLSIIFMFRIWTMWVLNSALVVLRKWRFNLHNCTTYKWAWLIHNLWSYFSVHHVHDQRQYNLSVPGEIPFPDYYLVFGWSTHIPLYLLQCGSLLSFHNVKLVPFSNQCSVRMKSSFFNVLGRRNGSCSRSIERPHLRRLHSLPPSLCVCVCVCVCVSLSLSLFWSVLVSCILYHSSFSFNVDCVCVCTSTPKLIFPLSVLPDDAPGASQDGREVS